MTDTALMGMRVITNEMLTEAGEPYQVRRPWRERLLSRPWRPFQATRTIVPQVPSKQVYRMNGTLVMHPETFRLLKLQSEIQR